MNIRVENLVKLKWLILVEDDLLVFFGGIINLWGYFVMFNIRLIVWNVFCE